MGVCWEVSGAKGTLYMDGECLGYFDVKVIETHDLIQGICSDADCHSSFAFGMENQRTPSVIETLMTNHTWVDVIKD